MGTGVKFFRVPFSFPFHLHYFSTAPHPQHIGTSIGCGTRSLTYACPGHRGTAPCPKQVHGPDLVFPFPFHLHYFSTAPWIWGSGTWSWTPLQKGVVHGPYLYSPQPPHHSSPVRVHGPQRGTWAKPNHPGSLPVHGPEPILPAQGFTGLLLVQRWYTVHTWFRPSLLVTGTS
jgi:hypothetical protein